MVNKKDLTPLTKRGQVVTNKGKGSSMSAHLPSRAALPSYSRPGATINDYAKGTPGPVMPDTPSIVDYDNDGM